MNMLCSYMKPSIALAMSDEQRRTLEAWVRAGTTPQRIVWRAKICLRAADGISNSAIARELGTTRPTVICWRNRFEAAGAPGLAEDAPHGASTRRLETDKAKSIVDAHPGDLLIGRRNRCQIFRNQHSMIVDCRSRVLWLRRKVQRDLG